MDQYLWTQNLITIISFIIKHLNPRLDSKWSMGADPVESKDQAGKMRPFERKVWISFVDDIFEKYFNMKDL